MPAQRAYAIREELNIQVQPKKGDKIALIRLSGSGVFVAARVTKHGGETTGTTFVNLDIDGINVVADSFQGAKEIGLAQTNPFGVVYLNAEPCIETLAIGFTTHLRFERELLLSLILNETDVA